MSAHVLGLDLGISKAGAAQLHVDGRLYTQRYTSDRPLPDDAPTADVAAAIRNVTRWAVQRATTATVLAVIEELPRGTTMGRHDERAAIVWAVVGQLIRHAIPVALVNPTSLKAKIAGNGRADKDRMRRAMHALYPGHGLLKVSYDETDALALATLGVMKLAAVRPEDGWTGPWLDARALNLDTGCRWPPELQPAPKQPLPAVASPFGAK